LIDLEKQKFTGFNYQSAYGKSIGGAGVLFTFSLNERKTGKNGYVMETMYVA